MSVLESYLSGVEAALEKIGAEMSMDQARDYYKNKQRESRQDAFLGSAAGIGTGLGTWGLESGLGANLPLSGKAAVIPAAALGYSLSKLKNVFDSPKEMYVRNGELTGRSIGGLAGLGLGTAGGAGIGAGIGAALDSTGLGMGLGAGLGGLLGQALGQEAGDYMTEVGDDDKVRKAKKEYLSRI